MVKRDDLCPEFFSRSLKLILISVLLLLPGCSTDRAQKTHPDLIYFNGKIVTVDSAFSIARAVAIKDDRFMAVGSDEDVSALAGPETRRVDLDGRTVVPGLIEAHAHPESASLSELEGRLPNRSVPRGRSPRRASPPLWEVGY